MIILCCVGDMFCSRIQSCKWGSRADKHYQILPLKLFVQFSCILAGWSAVSPGLGRQGPREGTGHDQHQGQPQDGPGPVRAVQVQPSVAPD